MAQVGRPGLDRSRGPPDNRRHAGPCGGRLRIPTAMTLLRSILKNERVMAGMFFVLVGGIALWMAMDLPAGSAKRMLEGYFPRVISGLLILVGVAIAAGGLRAAGADSADAPDAGWRPIVFVPLAMLSFGACIETLGLIPSIFIAVAILACSEEKRRWSETLLLGAVLSAIVYVIFVWALGLPLLLLPSF